MYLQVDHVVLVVTDLAEAVRNYRAAGFDPELGGSHPHSTGENALIALEDGSYLELFSFADPDKAAPTHANLRPFRKGGGFGGFWLRTQDLQGATEDLRAIGVPIEAPRSGNRVRPDGYDVRFKLAVPSHANYPFAPALIEDVTPMHERISATKVHPNGATWLSRVYFQVRAPEKAAELYSKLRIVDAQGDDDNKASLIAFRLGKTLLQIAPLPIDGVGEEGIVEIEIRNAKGQWAVIRDVSAIPTFV